MTGIKIVARTNRGEDAIRAHMRESENVVSKNDENVRGAYRRFLKEKIMRNDSGFTTFTLSAREPFGYLFRARDYFVHLLHKPEDGIIAVMEKNGALLDRDYIIEFI